MNTLVAPTPHWVEAFLFFSAAVTGGFFWELGNWGAKHLETWLGHFGK